MYKGIFFVWWFICKTFVMTIIDVAISIAFCIVNIYAYLK